MTADIPVVIVGAGPTGLAAAILLARRGIGSVVLEQRPQPYPLPRAVHLDDEVRRILQDLAVADAFARISRPASGLRLLDAGHRVIAEFRRDRTTGPHGHPQSTLFDQPDLEQLLRAELARHPQAELRTGTQVTGIDVTGTGPGRTPAILPVRVHHRSATPGGPTGTVTAQFVLGCDGANSLVRELIGARLEDLGFEERWLVLDLRSPTPLPVWDGVEQICDPRRAGTAMRIGTDRYRWEFRMHPGETVTGLTTAARLRALLAPWTGRHPDRTGTDRTGTDLEVLRAAEYTFRARLADRWRLGRIFLLGDAAHQTPPFIGQGLGAGLRDAHNLTWKLAHQLTAAGPTGQTAADRPVPWTSDQLLDSYQDERRPHARAAIRLAVVAGWAMTGGQDRAATARRILLTGFCRLPGATGLFLDRAGPALTPGPLVQRTGPGRTGPRRAGPRRAVPRWTGPWWAARLPHRPFRDPAGTLIPQPWVRIRGDEQQHRLDDVLGSGFALLLAPGTGLAHDLPLRALAGTLRAPVFRVLPDLGPGPGPGAGSPDPVPIVSADLTRWLLGRSVGAVLVRPDHVVLLARPSG